MDDIWTSNLKDTVDSIKNNNNVYTTGKVVKVNEYNRDIFLCMDVSFSVNDLNKEIVDALKDTVNNAIINKIYQPSKNELVFQIRNNFQNHKTHYTL